MKFRKLGTSDINVSIICLGTMTFGEQNSQSESFEQLDYAFNRGVNFFDTAEIYPIMPRKETYGKTEEIIGNWNLGFDKKNINDAIDASLKRLQTDYIDLYQLHWPERKIPLFGKLDFEYDPNDKDWTEIEIILENLTELVKSGKVRYIGLSNETPWGVMKFLQNAKEQNLLQMMSIQNVYNLVNRVFDIANSEVSIRENCGLLAYSPLAGGRLSGKYMNNNKPKNARHTLWPKRFSRHHTKRGEVAIEKYVNLAIKHNIVPSTFANAYVNDRPFVTSNIIGATTIDQLKENIDSVDITLSREILEEIEDIHLSDPNPCV